MKKESWSGREAKAESWNKDRHLTRPWEEAKAESWNQGRNLTRPWARAPEGEEGEEGVHSTTIIKLEEISERSHNGVLPYPYCGAETDMAQETAPVCPWAAR